MYENIMYDNMIAIKARAKAKALQEQNEAINNLFKKVSENVNKSEQLRCEINKETDKDIILDKALKCIALMTGDQVFYNMNKEKFL